MTSTPKRFAARPDTATGITMSVQPHAVTAELVSDLVSMLNNSFNVNE